MEEKYTIQEQEAVNIWNNFLSAKTITENEIEPFGQMDEKCKKFLGNFIGKQIPADLEEHNTTHYFKHFQAMLFLQMSTILLGQVAANNDILADIENGILTHGINNSTGDDFESGKNDLTKGKNIYEVLLSFFDKPNVLENFYFVVQGNITQKLATIQTKNLETDRYGNAEKIDGNFKIKISDYDDLKSISTVTRQVLEIFLVEFTKTKDPKIRLPLKNYMEMRELKNIDTARNQILDSMKTLEKIKFETYETKHGKDRFTGTISLYGGTGYVKNNVIYFNFNQDFFEILCDYKTMELSKQVLTINSKINPNSYYFQRYIDFNYRLNERNEKRVNTISMKTLIKQSQELPTYDEVAKTNRNFNQRIVQPTFRDLDVLENIKYKVFSEDDKEIQEPYQLSYDDFIRAKIKIDYSKYPKHPERLEKLKNYKTAQNGKTKKSRLK